MANLNETPQWEDGIYQIETQDRVVGGTDGIANRQAKQLANRTKYLKTEVEKRTLITDLISRAIDKGAALVGWKQSGTGAVDRTVGDKLREFVSVKDFGAVGDGVTDDTAAFTNALAEHNHVWVPEGYYMISGSGFSMKSGQSLIGVTPSEVDTTYATSGSCLVMDDAATRAIFITKGSGSTADSVSIDGIAFNGKNNDFAIYGDDFRQCKFSRLRFANFKKCIYAHQSSWLNCYEDIKAFDFDVFYHGNSGSEDSSMKNVIARSYRAGSSGVYLNYYCQTFHFDSCDFSECGRHIYAAISLGNCTLLFDSCYFEQSALGTEGVVSLAAATGSAIVASLRNCRIYNKSGGTLANSTAFKCSGSGVVEIQADGCVFTDMARYVHDVTGSTLTSISGSGNVSAGVAPSDLYYNTDSSARRLRFIGFANQQNLKAIGGVYVVKHDFTSGYRDIDFTGASTTGVFSIILSSIGHPGKRAEYKFQPKGFFGNGVVSEVYDATSEFSATVTGDVVRLTGPSGALVQILVEKLS